MDSTYKTKVLPSSTPIQNFGDSGYGTCKELRWATKTHSLSPIKEYLPLKKRITNLIESAKYPIFGNPCDLDFNTLEVVKELDFNISSDFLTESISDCYTTKHEVEVDSPRSFPSFHLKDLSDDKIILLKEKPNTQQREIISGQYNSVNAVFSILFPSDESEFSVEVTDVYKSKNRKIDFFTELGNRNLPSILTLLLSFLPAEDLTRVSCVSRKWNEMLRTDVNTHCRLKRFLKEKKSQKENRHPMISTITPDGRSCLRDGENKAILFNRRNVGTLSKQATRTLSNTKFDSFIKASENEQNILMKCPKCDYAARRQVEDIYICTECNHNFCKKCLSPFVKNHVCSKSLVSMIIGSKKSKRNLKRL